ncbi:MULTISPECIES: restriction endonuclease subunit S [Pseudomonadota]|uniref:restriction endonuclease subunit S n=1 Tax=Pseudomonadota TaxID=1224 RepID=UPI0022BED376|nr:MULTISPECIES: restriction endonuclease subunit S [Pseudomonadota]MCZ8074446.1 restriction endonuclease subunit S [Roseateles sp.]MCZ8094991.1 restriction endonuclease subunit S [Acidovorax sp.]MCZ8227665.1 restriction endonuclease subunit S [Burkholderiaceae bacterium]MCZ8017165.1 restriction endonuclease subunit S [Limnobacter sp.]MCZ8233290.1 restriction endonuclease subunit S [Novosphingobium sp.]
MRCNLGSLVDFQNGFAFKSKEYADSPVDGCEVLRMGYIARGGGFKEDDKPVYAPNSSKGNQERYRVSANDLVMAMTDMKDNVAILGCVAFINQDKRFLLNQRVGRLRVKDESQINPRFLYYLLNSQDVLRDIRSRANSGVQVNLTTAGILELQLDVPEPQIQVSIARILGALDDKIQTNQRINQTLEDIAKAIFKSWLVDFDPVRAKAEGRPTGLPTEISNLFPDGFEDSDIGEIPAGWTRCSLGVLVTPQRGKTITKSKCVEGGIPVVAGGLAPAYYHNVANVSAPVVTISASGANAGFARLYHEDIWASDCSYISKRQSRFVYSWYIFLKMNQSKIYHMQQGAAQPHIYPSDLMRMEVVCSDDEKLWHHLETIVSPLFKRISICETQNQVLAELRDTLLPKLISGELRIPDAEKFLEEAGV